MVPRERIRIPLGTTSHKRLMIQTCLVTSFTICLSRAPPVISQALACCLRAWCRAMRLTNTYPIARLQRLQLQREEIFQLGLVPMGSLTGEVWILPRTLTAFRDQVLTIPMMAQVNSNLLHPWRVSKTTSTLTISRSLCKIPKDSIRNTEAIRDLSPENNITLIN